MLSRACKMKESHFRLHTYLELLNEHVEKLTSLQHPEGEAFAVDQKEFEHDAESALLN